MIYVKKFLNNNQLDEYRKSNFISPHLFFDSNERKVKFFEKYQKLDYISSTATGGQYIDLGCHLMENTDDIKIDIKFNIRGVGKSSSGNDSNLATLIGSQPEVNPWPGFLLRRYSAQNNSIVLQTKWNFTNSFQQSNKYYSKCLTDSSGEFVQMKYIYEFSETLDNIPQSQVSNTPCTLFCAYDANGNPFRFALADLYYLKITKGGKVIRNLIPVRKLSTNEVGLYDMENDHLYVSQGDEPFEGDFIYDHEI